MSNFLVSVSNTSMKFANQMIGLYEKYGFEFCYSAGETWQTIQWNSIVLGTKEEVKQKELTAMMMMVPDITRCELLDIEEFKLMEKKRSLIRELLDTRNALSKSGVRFDNRCDAEVKLKEIYTELNEFEDFEPQLTYITDVVQQYEAIDKEDEITHELRTLKAEKSIRDEIKEYYNKLGLEKISDKFTEVREASFIQELAKMKYGFM